jgi:hypothetical protein
MKKIALNSFLFLSLLFLSSMILAQDAIETAIINGNKNELYKLLEEKKLKYDDEVTYLRIAHQKFTESCDAFMRERFNRDTVFKQVTGCLLITFGSLLSLKGVLTHTRTSLFKVIIGCNMVFGGAHLYKKGEKELQDRRIPLVKSFKDACEIKQIFINRLINQAQNQQQ